ncbi:MAG: right-handed parallel beta-helix repeat-containing protein [Acidobacteria bacterium]|nr:right-handed parallel beta-helix repeat-containing protein [Acidobacteriota bacterium]
MPLSRLSLAAIVCAWTALAQNATIPGEVTAPYPTITNLAVEWKIQGDDNLNGVVEVRYRRAGESAWREAMPLRRVPAGTSRTTRPVFRWENRHSGSIFDLSPGTEYEISLKLSDPDGGAAEKLVRAATRAVPRDPKPARRRKAGPRNLHELAARSRPGDVILLAAGSYGKFTVPRDGAAGKPIVFRSPEGGAVFTGVDLRGRKHVHLEGVTSSGSIDLLGGEWLVVRRCRVNAKYGIIASDPPGTSNAYIADNVVTGPERWERMRMGAEPPPGYEGNEGEGIQITGSGNVVCHNRVRGYRDCISFMEDTRAAQQVCNDVYNNDISIGNDDAIEADFAMGNCRILRNRITNCFMGLSSQPGLGGPTYFIRNVMYNITNSPFKLSRYSSGDVILNNTCVKVGDGLMAPHKGWSHALLRNNLCIGGTGGGMFGRYHSGPGRAVYLPGPEETADLDYDAVGSHGLPFEGLIRAVRFHSIEEMRSRTGERHAVQVDMDVFHDTVPFPDPAIPEWPVPDLRIRAGSPAAGAGIRLANINDGDGVKAPAIGAYEVGQPLPLYGPRPVGVDE